MRCKELRSERLNSNPRQSKTWREVIKLLERLNMLG